MAAHDVPTGPRWLVPLVFLALVPLPLLMHLDTLPLRMWDESRQAIAAYEMVHNGDWLVPHFNGQPDLWSTKPPLLIWLQALLFGLLGPGELGLRLPSALAAVVTCWLLVRMASRSIGSPWMGLMAAIILITSGGYLHWHVARSGDYDALLVLFMTASGWWLLRWCEKGEPRSVIWMFAFLMLGALTKGVQALLFAPGLVAFLLLERKLLALLRTRAAWLGILLFLVPVIGYYLARERLNPGYLSAVWANELGGRYSEALEGHRHAWYFYLRMLVQHHFTPWWLLVPGGVLLGLSHRDARLRRFTAFLTCVSAGYLLVISSAGTKLEWYSAPALPLLALLASIPLHVVLQLMHAEPMSTSVLRWRALPVAAAIALFAEPYRCLISRFYFPEEQPWDVEPYAMSHYLHKAVRGGPLESDAYCQDGYTAHLDFYARLLNDQGRRLAKVEAGALTPGMRVMAQQAESKLAIASGYAHQVLLDAGALRIYAIEAKRDSLP
jgi:4-amino-4-deoxy-L-arabinose transferase-like glycosyltransferase